MAGPEVPLPAAQPSSSSSSLSFTQGFLLGQLSIVILIFCFIKFFIFGEPLPADERALHLSSLRRTRTLAHHARKTSASHRPSSSGGPHPTLRHKASSILRQPPAPLTPAAILSKTYYNVNSHQPESLDWFNVLVAQTIAQLRADARQDNAILTSLTNVLNRPGKPDFLGEIRITEIELGDEFPIFSNCRVIPVNEGSGGDALRSESGRLQARLDVDLSDVITLGIETTLVLNWPKPVVAVLPVALSVSVVRFSGTLSLSFMPSDDAAGPGHLANDSSISPSSRTALTFTFLDDYRLDLSVRSLVGSRSRLQDVPKIAQLVESRLHAWFDERVVEPRFQQIVLPSLWPRKRTARGGEDEEETVASTTEGSVDERHSTFDNASDHILPKRTARKDLSPGSAAMFRERQRSRGPSSDRSSMEARLMAEGSKIREAEEREERLRARREERHRHSTLGQQPGSRPRDWQLDRDSEGMRWRNTHDQVRNRPEPHRNNSLRPSTYSERGRQRDEWDDSRSMPGGMPGV